MTEIGLSFPEPHPVVFRAGRGDQRGPGGGALAVRHQPVLTNGITMNTTLKITESWANEEAPRRFRASEGAGFRTGSACDLISRPANTHRL